ncbi:hypothetical protein OG226_04880 [Streptomyces sp. NBC_01261]|uniref:hypothetical protein n=1 Tax=Streptomyces sp. NBC_01261 TaxID=2903802 RepID=UPI002E2FDB99|nr:hypothetical protein [Streptomyces sp. NBC_01261]
MLWTPAVHATDGRGRMILTYPAGDVGYPLPDASRGSQALTTSAHLLRHYHDATTDLAQHLGSDWQFDALVPVEVICHGDFVPYLPRRHPRKGRRTHRLRRRPPRPPRLGPRLRPLPLRPPLTHSANHDGWGTTEQQAYRARDIDYIRDRAEVWSRLVVGRDRARSAARTAGRTPVPDRS